MHPFAVQPHGSTQSIFSDLQSDSESLNLPLTPQKIYCKTVGWGAHFSAASITYDVWRVQEVQPQQVGPAYRQLYVRSFNASVVFFPPQSLFLLQSTRVRQTILSSPSLHYGSEGSLLGNMAYLISAYRSRWAANACSKSLFFPPKPRTPLKESSVEITNENLAGGEAPICQPSYECYTSF